MATFVDCIYIDIEDGGILAELVTEDGDAYFVVYRCATDGMEDAIIKIIDLENEINQDMMKLVELKKDIIRRIKAVESAELQTILELRYLSYMRWEEIAIELGYGIDNVFRLHRNALDEITIPETIQ